jgi:hypothetical protein
MMPWESWNARDTAWLRIERASARTIEEEMAARWWGKKDWGEARPSVWREKSQTDRHLTLYPKANTDYTPGDAAQHSHTVGPHTCKCRR